MRVNNICQAMITFEVTHGSTKNSARRGWLQTQHSRIETPVFMPVGTQAVVKSLDAQDLERLNTKIILANAYHLMIRPGAQLIAQLGGLHRFMNFSGSILTDSGGFQVFSLAGLRQVNDHGVSFRSHVDGSLFELTPEKLVEVQEDLEPDIAMVLDECPPGQAERLQVTTAVARTTTWAKRCLAARKKPNIAWFGIVQGGTYLDLRLEHATTLRELDFDGFAVGGVSVGENPVDIDRIVQAITPALPNHKPRYLMGVGRPVDLIRSVAAGIDMFDCVLPTRNARNGQFFTPHGPLVIKNAKHKFSAEPIQQDCTCSTCQNYSRAYLRHLYLAREISYHRLATIHNITFLMTLMHNIRTAIMQDTFEVNTWLEPWLKYSGKSL